MKKYYLSLFIVLTFFGAPIVAAAKTAAVAAKTAPAKPKAWKPVTPDGYAPIAWAQAPGVATFFKVPKGNGSMDFITRIYLPQNQIAPVIAGDPIDNGPADSNFLPDRPAEVPDPAVKPDVERDFSYNRVGAEVAKGISASIKFIWNGPFFNMANGASDLSMALKYMVNGTSTVTSGSRSAADMALDRRMLLIDNGGASATIAGFDSLGFLDKTHDFAFEGFAPTVEKSDGSVATGRLFMGVSADGKELDVYCSQQATVKEASDALVAAGIALNQQIQADGGGSAACGYNLPGQFFVEPTRTLPLLMGATTILARGKVSLATMNVRKGPGTKYPVVKQLVKGASVAAFEEQKGWYRIGDGEWVLKSLIK